MVISPMVGVSTRRASLAKVDFPAPIGAADWRGRSPAYPFEVDSVERLYAGVMLLHTQLL